MPRYQCWWRYWTIQNEVPKRFLWVLVWISAELRLYKCSMGNLEVSVSWYGGPLEATSKLKAFCCGMGLGRAGSSKAALVSQLQVQSRNVLPWCCHHQVLLLCSSLAFWGSSWFDMKRAAKLQAGNVLTVWDEKSLIIPAVGKVSTLHAYTVFGLSASLWEGWERCQIQIKTQDVSTESKV